MNKIYVKCIAIICLLLCGTSLFAQQALTTNVPVPGNGPGVAPAQHLLLNVTTTGSATICNGASATITIYGNQYDTVTYNENGGSNQSAILGSAGTGAVTKTPAVTDIITLVSVKHYGGGAAAITGQADTITVRALPYAYLASNSPICSGQSAVIGCFGTARATVNFNNGGGSFYIDSTYLGNALVYPTATTTYTGVVVDATGCSAPVAPITIVVNPLPTATITSTDTTAKCSGTPATISITGGTPGATVTLNNGGGNVVLDSTGNGSIIVAPANTTTYTATVSNSVCSASAGSVTIPVKQVPHATISGGSGGTICSGQSFLIGVSGTAYTTVTLNNGGGTIQFSNSGLGSIYVHPTDTTTYTGTIVDTAGCTGTVTGTVTVNTYPAQGGTLTGDTTVCGGQPVTIRVTGGTPNAWVAVDYWTGFQLDNAGNGSGQVYPFGSGTITATTTGSNGCSDALLGGAVVTVHPTPQVALTGDTTICSGNAVTLYLTGNAPNATVAINNADGTTVLDSFGNGSITFVPSASDYYSATVTNTAGCSANTTSGASVTISQPATVSIEGGGDLCEGSIAYIYGYGPSNTTILLNGTDTLQISYGGFGYAMVSPMATTTYTGTILSAAGCVDSTVTGDVTVTINPVPAATITGDTICAGGAAVITAQGTPNATISLRDGNYWLWLFIFGIDNSYHLILDSAGNGSVTVYPSASYTYTTSITNAGGCTGTVSGSASVVVNQAPWAYITGDTSICNGGQTTILAYGTPGATVMLDNDGGTMTIDNAGNGSTVVAPASNTTYTGTVSIGTCAGSANSVTISITLPPDAGAIAGLSTVAVGSSLTLTDNAVGGTWSSTNSSIAMVDTNGVVNGIAAGADTIQYTVTNSCGSTAVASYGITVIGAGTIHGQNYVCAGSSITLTDSVAGGTWSSVFGDSLSHITQGGVLTGNAQGVDTILYTVGVAVARYKVTVYNNPVANAGSDVNICPAGSVTLTGTATGSVSPAYNWSPSTGLSCTNCASPVAHPAATTSYVLTVTKNTCTSKDTVVVTVNPLPNAGAINGLATAATGATITLTNTGSNGAGTWSSSNTAIATVDGSGMVTALAAGYDTIRYTVSSSCGTAVASKAIAIGSAGYIKGQSYVCAGSSIMLTDSAGTPGGMWSVSGTHAAVNQSGVVTGLNQGTAIIKYTVYGMTAQKTITVYDLPIVSAGSDASICPASSTTLTATGGTSYSWSPATGLSCTTCASPSAHPVVTTTYIVTGTKTGCSSKDTVVVTVNPLPNAGAITGPNNGITGSSITLADTATGGTWTTNNLMLASVSSTGVVTGLADGTDTIKYTATNGCGTAIATKVVTFANPGYLTGQSYVCAGTTISLADSAGTPGGTWSVNTHASIDQNGVLTGLTQGTATVKYTVNGVPVQKNVTVYDLPAVNAGNDVTICYGSSTTLNVTGATIYNWTPANGLGCTTCASQSVSPTATTSYIVTGTKTGCTAKDTVTVTVNAQSNAGVITGASLAAAGQTIILTDSAAVSGGVWSSSNPDAVTVSSTGVVTPVNGTGIATIYYSVTSVTCGTTAAGKAVTFGNAGAITGTNYMCVGSTLSLADTAATPGGIWSSTNTAHATVDQNGVITGLTQGVDTIKYTYGTAVTTLKITVYNNPVIDAGNDTTILVGQAVQLNATGGTSYIWIPAAGLSCANCANPSVTPTVTTTYVVTGTKTGCSARDTVVVHVAQLARNNQTESISNTMSTMDVRVYPNPTHNQLNIELTANNEDMHITLIDVAGRTVAEIVDTKQAMGNQHVTYNASSLAGGVYYVHIELGAQVITQKVVIE